MLKNGSSKMDFLQTANNNNNNNDDATSSCTSKEDPRGGIRHRYQLHPPPPAEKQDQFGEEKQENQVPEGTSPKSPADDAADCDWKRSWSHFKIGDEVAAGEGKTDAVIEEHEDNDGVHPYVVQDLFSNGRFARVDLTVDFFVVDEELEGRFRIVTGELQQAIIFKIKTTTPSCFRVRPIYGLMRPRVTAWISVKSEHKTLDQGQFLVEVCPLPGAIFAMTSDLYTTRVRSNFQELESIWERVELQLQENMLPFTKELHRVVCRFQREFPSSRNNDHLLAKLPPELFQLAREGSVSPGKEGHADSVGEGKREQRTTQEDSSGKGYCCCCFKKLKCDFVRKSSFLLGTLLMLAIGYIVYSELYGYYYGFSCRSSNSKNGGTTIP